MTARAAAASLVLLFVCGGCGGGGSTDPRCASLCIVTEPDLAGAYDVCSASSADSCQRECDARIADVTTVCASCLLEEACFGSGCDSYGDPTFCDSSGQCTVTGREGQCTYAEGDQAARDGCLRQVFPRRTVECAPEFRSVSECSDLCGTGGQADGGR
jgi:hypothetical protein